MKFIVRSRINTVQTPVTIWASNKLTYDQETIDTNNLVKTEATSRITLLDLRASTKKDLAVVKNAICFYKTSIFNSSSYN